MRFPATLSVAVALAGSAHGWGRDPTEQKPLGPEPKPAAAAGGKKPNIVFIITDDQDLHMNSLDYIPFVQKHLIDRGTLYKKHFCTTALCCPSRVSLWTGKLAHNTNVTDVNPPHGWTFPP